VPFLQPFGPLAFRVALPSRWVEDLGGRAALARALLQMEGIDDALVTETTALVVCAHAPSSRTTDALEAEIARALDVCAAAPLATHATREIDVVYDGPDLVEVARALEMSERELVERHTACALDVSFLGFVPGFAYLRGLDARLATVPRRASPRPAVPPYSVAIAAGMSAIYPAASPGGWNLIGRAVDFDPLATPLTMGERIRFRAVPARTRTPTSSTTVAASETRDALEITAVAGPTLVIDPRPLSRLRHGAPCGGPLAPSIAMRALRALGAPSGHALLERHGALTVVLRGTTARRISDERAEAITLAPGQSHTLAAPRDGRVGYVAIEGGLDVPLVLGGRGTLLSVQRGGHEGRVLRRGDRLPLGPRDARCAPVEAAEGSSIVGPLPVARGPDLVSAHGNAFRVRIAHASDRTGTRLVPLEPHGLVTREAESAPTMRGVVQAPPSGELIVLGPDHPVTGGYPVLGILGPEACDALFARPLGSEVALCLVP
jgi:KipI family sensor histidine kinase inhibitor